MVPEIRLKGILRRFSDEVAEVLAEAGPLPDPDKDVWFGQAMGRAEAAMAEIRDRVGSP